MKVKLLKKVRKRFEILHYPKGIIRWSEHWNYNIFILTDSKSGVEYYTQLGRNEDEAIQCVSESKIFDTEKECIEYLQRKMINRLRNEYQRRKTEIINNTQIKVWYDKK